MEFQSAKPAVTMIRRGSQESMAAVSAKLMLYIFVWIHTAPVALHLLLALFTIVTGIVDPNAPHISVSVPKTNSFITEQQLGHAIR